VCDVDSDLSTAVSRISAIPYSEFVPQFGHVSLPQLRTISLNEKENCWAQCLQQNSKIIPPRVIPFLEPEHCNLIPGKTGYQQGIEPSHCSDHGTSVTRTDHRRKFLPPLVLSILLQIAAGMAKKRLAFNRLVRSSCWNAGSREAIASEGRFRHPALLARYLFSGEVLNKSRLPKSKVISHDGDIPLLAECSECATVFDAGQAHTVEANYAELERQFITHCKEKHPVK
jgi:hypothetical protein